MTKSALLFCLCSLMLLSLSATSSLSAKPSQTDSVRLIVLHTNDIHSRIDAVEKDAARNADKGGALRRDAAVRQIRQEARELGAEVILLDAGDYVQGTPYFNLFHGKLEVDLMNRMAYDAATLGNHEFDRGMEALAKMLKPARFPIVCSNYDLSSTCLAGKTLPYLVVQKGSLKIGIVSANVKLDNLVPASRREGVVYEDPIALADNYAAMLKAQGCHIVICLSHLGYSSYGVCDIKLAENTRHIDLIIGGHSHTFLKAPKLYNNLDDRPVPVTQMGKDGIYLGRVDLMIQLQ